jgi:hypothetical protein
MVGAIVFEVVQVSPSFPLPRNKKNRVVIYLIFF